MPLEKWEGTLLASAGLFSGVGAWSSGRGQSRMERPLSRLDQYGLNSYFDPDLIIIYQ
jgi:hypothetical protein